eukprot:12421237-Karenia_brevis.AAC.1
MESNPWLDQMYHDIQHLEGMDGIYEDGEEYRDIFINFDMQQLKAKHIRSNSFAPEGTMSYAYIPSDQEEVPDEDDKSY